MTHSLPAWLLWPLVIALPVAYGFGVPDKWRIVFAWTAMAVMLHVLLNLLNAYGVQWLRPFDRRWWHLDVLPLFDPVLFAAHASGLAGWWAFGFAPGPLFAAVYGFSALFVGIRWIIHARLVRLVPKRLGLDGVCMVVPGLFWRRWQFIVETERSYYTGHIRAAGLSGFRAKVRNVYTKKRQPGEVVRATMGTDGVRAFLHFAQNIHVDWREKQDGNGYEVRWRNIRFWNDRDLSFGVGVHLDRNMRVVHQHLGWRKRAWDPPYV